MKTLTKEQIEARKKFIELANLAIDKMKEFNQLWDESTKLLKK